MTSLITIFLLFFCCALQLDLIAAQNNRQCLTPSRAAGICINLDQCPVLNSLLVSAITQADSELLSSSQCGYANKTIQVCCPTQTEVKRIVTINLSTTERPTETSKEATTSKPCVTPYHENATCIQLNQCFILYDLLLVRNVKLTNANKEFLSRSQCGYENNKVLICCPDRLRVRSPPMRVTTTQAPPKSLLPSPPNCGFALKNRIYGGAVAGIDEFPWLTLIEYTKGRNAKGFHCGGALINDRYVLTAAHCTKGRSIPTDWTLSGVRLGEYDTTTYPDCEVTFNGRPDCNTGHVDFSVEKIVAHPEYDQDSSNKQHDIALLRLATVVSFSKFIRPICLPIAANLLSVDFIGTGMDIAGWGRTETSQSSNFKLKANLNVWSLEDCITIYNTVNISIERTHMCAGGVEDVGSCSVDSGGPLMVEISSGGFYRTFVAGIASFGPVPCGRKSWPGVYTKIDSYINWIQDNVLP